MQNENSVLFYAEWFSAKKKVTCVLLSAQSDTSFVPSTFLTLLHEIPWLALAGSGMKQS